MANYQHLMKDNDNFRPPLTAHYRDPRPNSTCPQLLLVLLGRSLAHRISMCRRCEWKCKIIQPTARQQRQQQYVWPSDHHPRPVIGLVFVFCVCVIRIIIQRFPISAAELVLISPHQCWVLSKIGKIWAWPSKIRLFATQVIRCL